MNKKEVNIIHYLYVTVKWRKFLIINFIIVCVIAAAISLILPKWYKAETTILPPMGEAGDLGLSSIISSLPVSGLGLGLGLGGVSEETNIFMAILNSRTVMESVAKKFDLMKRYRTRNMEETIKVLQDHISAKINEEGTITLSAEAKTPFLSDEDEENEARQLAKNMANFFIEELNKVNTQLKIEKAHNMRIFIEKRYHQNLEDLRHAEEDLKQFQQKYGAISLPEQTAASITAAAELKAEIIAQEVKLGVLSKYVNDTHPEFIRAQNELRELTAKYDEFKFGAKVEENIGNNLNETNDIFLPFQEVPGIGLQYFRLYREVKLQETLLEFLLPQYEQAKLQEAKDTPSVQVLDHAVAPERKSRPKRMIIVLLSGFLSLFFGMITAFFNEYYQRIKSEENYDYSNMKKIVEALKKDLSFIKRKKN